MVIGKNIEDGNTGANGITKAYTVTSIENIDGEVYVKAREILYLEDSIILEDPKDSTKNQTINYNVSGEILDEKGNKTGNKVVLTSPGVPLVSDGKLTILDENNVAIKDHNYKLAGATLPVYSDQLTSLPFSSIKKIF